MATNVIFYITNTNAMDIFLLCPTAWVFCTLYRFRVFWVGGWSPEKKWPQFVASQIWCYLIWGGWVLPPNI